MATEKLIRRAKVTLTKGKTYTIGGKKFIRNVPRVMHGSICDDFKCNGRFSCVELEARVSKVAKKKKKKLKSSSSSDKDSKKSKIKSKKSKSSSKKKGRK